MWIEEREVSLACVEYLSVKRTLQALPKVPLNMNPSKLVADPLVHALVSFNVDVIN